MRKKILTKTCMALMTVCVLLVGCGEKEAADNVQIGAENETQYEDKDGVLNIAKVGQNSLFPGTILDNLIIGETLVTDVEELLKDKILEYETTKSTPNYLSGKTTITDNFYEWKALYKYAFAKLESKDDLVLEEWTVELLLNDDDEYKDAVKLIQSTMEENTLTEYTTVDDEYSSDVVEGNIVYYPLQKTNLDGKDYIKCIGFGKYANCDKEVAKHIIILRVGVVSEENYLKGNEPEGPKVVELKPDELAIPEAIIKEKENSINYRIIASSNVMVDDVACWFTDEQIENLVTSMEQLIQTEMTNVIVHIGHEIEYYKEIPIVPVMFECDQGAFEGYAEIDTACIATYIG